MTRRGRDMACQGVFTFKLLITFFGRFGTFIIAFHNSRCPGFDDAIGAFCLLVTLHLQKMPDFHYYIDRVTQIGL